MACSEARPMKRALWSRGIAETTIGLESFVSDIENDLISNLQTMAILSGWRKGWTISDGDFLVDLACKLSGYMWTSCITALGEMLTRQASCNGSYPSCELLQAVSDRPSLRTLCEDRSPLSLNPTQFTYRSSLRISITVLSYILLLIKFVELFTCLMNVLGSILHLPLTFRLKN